MKKNYAVVFLYELLFFVDKRMIFSTLKLKMPDKNLKQYS